MSMMNIERIITGPRTYLTVTGEDLRQVLNWLDTIKAYALSNASEDVSELDHHPPTTTFKFPLPPCMSVEIHMSDQLD